MWHGIKEITKHSGGEKWKLHAIHVSRWNFYITFFLQNMLSVRNIAQILWYLFIFRFTSVSWRLVLTHFESWMLSSSTQSRMRRRCRTAVTCVASSFHPCMTWVSISTRTVCTQTRGQNRDPSKYPNQGPIPRPKLVTKHNHACSLHFNKAQTLTQVNC